MSDKKRTPEKRNISDYIAYALLGLMAVAMVMLVIVVYTTGSVSGGGTAWSPCC